MRFIAILYILLFSFIGQSQIYKTTGGIRLDDEQFGMSVTQRVLPSTSVELYADLASNNFQTGINARQHVKLAGRRLNWYPQAGAHIGTFKNYGSFGGVDIGIGAEYKFILFPAVISFDMMPSIHLAGNHPDWWNFNTVFSIKYIFVKDKKVKLPKRKESDED